MSANFQILGKPGRDNSLFTRIDAGNRLYRILIDCGEGTVSYLPQNDIKSTDILLFSHLHLDHLAGFDYFFRRTFDRTGEAVHIYGPAETSSILHNRFMGFMWNLTEGLSNGYYVNDILKEEINTYFYDAHSGFADKKFTGQKKFQSHIFENTDIKISAANLNHRITSLGYNIRETDSININKEELINLNFEPGPWLHKVKDQDFSDHEEIIINDKNYSLGDLRKKLLITSLGNSITYLTDFVFDRDSRNAAVNLAKNSDVLICESQYLHEDESLALKNYHLTSTQAARIALQANVNKLILFHVSERYIHEPSLLRTMLEEARTIFPETYFPEHWSLL